MSRTVRKTSRIYFLPFVAWLLAKKQPAAGSVSRRVWYVGAMYYGEKLNSISHLVGAALALIGLGALLTIGIQSGDLRQIIGFSVFGVTLVLLYTMSTLYHSFHPPGLKRAFMVFDHVAIYLLIAGTYTPYMLITLRDGNG